MVNKYIKQWESKDQSKFYAMIMIAFGWLFLSVGYNSLWMKVFGAGYCFGYGITKLNSQTKPFTSQEKKK